MSAAVSVLGVLLAAIRKDVQLLRRDRGALLSLFVLPLIFTGVFGSVFERKDPPAPDLVVWAADRAAPTAVMTALTAAGWLNLVSVPDADEVRRQVAAGKFDAGLILPAELGAVDVPGLLLFDRALPVQGRVALEASLRLVVERALRGPPIAGGGLVVVDEPGLIPPVLVGFQLAVPGNAVLFGFFLALTVALSFTEERQSGVWRRLMAAPVSHAVVLIAKLVPYVLIGLVQLGFLFGLSHLAFDLQVDGSLVALAVLSLALVLCATSLGLLFAAVGRTAKQLGSVGSICLLVMGLVGGTMMPRPSMPAAMQSLGLATPHAWALDGYYALIVRDGAGLGDVAGSIAALLGFAAVFATIGVVRFRFDR